MRRASYTAPPNATLPAASAFGPAATSASTTSSSPSALMLTASTGSTAARSVSVLPRGGEGVASARSKAPAETGNQVIIKHLEELFGFKGWLQYHGEILHYPSVMGNAHHAEIKKLIKSYLNALVARASLADPIWFNKPHFREDHSSGLRASSLNPKEIAAYFLFLHLCHLLSSINNKADFKANTTKLQSIIKNVLARPMLLNALPHFADLLRGVSEYLTLLNTRIESYIAKGGGAAGDTAITPSSPSPQVKISESLPLSTSDLLLKAGMSTGGAFARHPFPVSGAGSLAAAAVPVDFEALESEGKILALSSALEEAERQNAVLRAELSALQASVAVAETTALRTRLRESEEDTARLARENEEAIARLTREMSELRTAPSRINLASDEAIAGLSAEGLDHFMQNSLFKILIQAASLHGDFISADCRGPRLFHLKHGDRGMEIAGEWISTLPPTQGSINELAKKVGQSFYKNYTNRSKHKRLYNHSFENYLLLELAEFIKIKKGEEWQTLFDHYLEDCVDTAFNRTTFFDERFVAERLSLAAVVRAKLVKEAFFISSAVEAAAVLRPATTASTA